MEEATHPAEIFEEPHDNKRPPLNRPSEGISRQDPFLTRFQLFPVLEAAAQEQLLTWLPPAEA